MAGVQAQRPESGPNDSQLLTVFEERAEYLSRELLESWTALGPRDEANLTKLKGPGTKLLSGPRGSGKSTLLRKAYYDLIDDQRVVVAYVNYANSLALEPLLHSRGDALQVFRQWLIFKIILGVNEALIEQGADLPETLCDLATVGGEFVEALAAGAPLETTPKPISPSRLVALLEVWMREIGRNRVVLLLDDAAHAFSPEQQREFFEVFRELRSRNVAAKAAVYPGVTAYSPNFHVGHEAELIEAWYRPDDADYLPAMREIVERRIPAEMRVALEERPWAIDLFALASFGLPRGFLTMLSQVLGVTEGAGAGSSVTRRSAEKAVADYAARASAIFSSLADKLPRYLHFIETGQELQGQIVSTLAEFNLRKSVDSKAVTIALREPLGVELNRVLNMLEYAGLVRELPGIAKGARSVYRRYDLHYALTISERALSLGSNYQIQEVVEALRVRDAHAYVRSNGEALLGQGFEQRCTLDLAPCTNCGTPRPSEDARFCMKCGSELEDASIYDELLRSPISQLPLTETRVRRIEDNSDLRTIQDVLTDEENKKLHAVPYIGSVWATKIRRYAEEFVSM